MPSRSAVSLLALLGCSPLLTEYEVGPDGGSPELEPDGAPMERAPITPRTEGGPGQFESRELEFAEYFFDGAPRCSACMNERCQQAMRACTEQSGCYDFATCQLQDPSPAAEPYCVQRFGPDLSARAAYANLRECWLGECASECNSGTDWRCLGNYEWPRPDLGSARLIQTLLEFGDDSRPIVGADVYACASQSEGCGPGYEDEALAHAVSDESGTYALDVSVRGDLWGFWGYRRILAEGVYPIRSHYSVPFVAEHVETTRLLTDSYVEQLAKFYALSKERGHVLFQVFDCSVAPALDAVVRFEGDAADARIYYAVFPVILDESLSGTTRTGEGNGAVAQLEVGRLHGFAVQIESTAELISNVQVFVPAGELVKVDVYPRGAVR